MGQGKESGSSRLGRGAAAGCIGTFFLVACALLWARAHTGLLELLAASVASYLLVWGLYAFLSDLPRAELQSRFLLTTFAGLACIAVFEGPAFLGLVDYRVVFATEDRHGGRPGYRWDDELLWTPEPHHERRGTFTRGNIGEAFCLPRHPPQDFHVRYDQNGFRNDFDPERADIVVIGDSYVESPMLPTSALLTTVLGTLQQKVVVNLGISGFGPQQTLAVLKHYAVELHPKTAVWLFYEGNDLVDAERYDQMRDTWRGRRGKLRAAWHRSFTRNASRAVVRLLRRCVPQADPQESFGVLRTADGTETTVYFVDKPVGLTASDLERLEKVRAAIEEAYALCRERGIRFVLVFVPSTYRVYRGLPNFRPGMESLAQLKINDLPERLRALAHRISPQMEFLDLLPALRAATAEGVLTFIPDDTHWTAQGHQAVAMAIHKHLGPR